MSIKETAEIRPEHRPFIEMGHKIRATLEPGSGVDWDDEMFNRAAELSTQLIQIGTNFGPKTPAEAVKNAGLDVEGFKAIIAKVNGKKESVAEGLADMAQIAEQDHEVQMARAELYKIAKYAIKLHDMLKGVTEAEGIEGWQQAKITKAADYIGSVYHALEYDMLSEPATPSMTPESKAKYLNTLSEKMVQKKTQVSEKKAKPDFLDVDKDGNKKEPMKKALKDKEKKTNEAVVAEKAKSKAQQKFMGMVYAAKKGEKPASKEVAKVAKGMSKADAKDYAQTKHKGKPEHVKKK